MSWPTTSAGTRREWAALGSDAASHLCGEQVFHGCPERGWIDCREAVELGLYRVELDESLGRVHQTGGDHFVDVANVLIMPPLRL